MIGVLECWKNTLISCLPDELRAAAGKAGMHSPRKATLIKSGAGLCQQRPLGRQGVS